MTYDRYFLFGCSWTKYYWPTWADIIRYATNKPAYNWGRPGIGNVGIVSRLVECDLKYKFTKRDAIIIQWSSWTREDRFVDNNWKAYGNVFNNQFYDAEFIKKYWDWNNDVIKNANSIILANKSYDIAYQFNMIDYVEKESGHEQRSNNNLVDFYLPHLPTLDKWPYQQNTCFKNHCMDPHPDIFNHLYFFNHYIKPKFDLALGEQELRLERLHTRLCNKLNKDMTYRETQTTVMNLVQLFDSQFSFDNEGF